MEACNILFKSMKILFIYKYLTLGGVETVLRARLEALHGMGISASAWFLGDYGGRNIFSGLENDIYIGHDALSLDDLSAYDVISSVDTEEIIPRLQGLSPSTRVIFEAHSPYLENLEYLRSRDFRRLNVLRVLVPSQYQKHVVMRFGISGDRVGVVPNLLGRQFFFGSQEFPLTQKPIILWVGRLDHLKNWKGFLDLVAELSSSKIKAVALMVGTSNNPIQIASEVFQAIRKRSISGEIRWFSTIPYQVMVNLYDLVARSQGVVVSTSRNESFGLSIAESMSRGCPVVVPSIGSFDDFIVDTVSGCVYQNGSLRQLKQQVSTLLENDEVRGKISSRGKEVVRELYNPSRIVKIFIDEIRSVINSD